MSPPPRKDPARKASPGDAVRKASPVVAVRQTLARRRERAVRVRLRTGTGQPRLLDEDDPSAEALVEAAEALISASQRASKRT